jgi:hypothetical protein
MKARTLTLTTLLALGPLLAGCSSDADAVCEKRKDCFNDALDLDACGERVETWVEEGEGDERQERVEGCARCIDGLTCVQVRESCAIECFDIPS